MENIRLCVKFFPVFYLLSISILLIGKPEIYKNLFSFEQIVEWIQFYFYLIAAAIGFITYLRLRKKSLKKHQVLVLLFSLGCFFIAGEEINWGQLVMDSPAPDIFQRLNTQAQTNIHNLEVIQDKVHLIFIVIGLYGGLSWMLKRFIEKNDYREFLFVDRLYALYFIPVSFFYFYLDYINPLNIFVIGNHQEVFETLLSLGFFLVSLSNYQKTKLLTPEVIELFGIRTDRLLVSIYVLAALVTVTGGWIYLYIYNYT